MWQAQHTEHPSGAAARVAAAGPRLAFVWQAHYTEPSGGAAARMAATGPRLAFMCRGAAHRASWRICGTRGHRSPAAGFRVAGALHRAFWRRLRVAQSLMAELRRVWPPLARGWLSCERRSTQSFLEELPRVAAAGFRVAGAVHRA